ncbi:MAG: LuxR C-terminal-related transcriptional regulator [Anaerolineae bacterium]
MIRLTVMIVASTAVMRAGLRDLLAEVPDIEVVDEAADRESLQAQLSQPAPDVVLVGLDAELDMTGIEAAWLIKALRPASKVLLLSTDQEPDTVVGCLAAGADGYLPPDLDQAALAKAIRDVVHYGLVLADDVASAVRKRLAGRLPAVLPAALTPREREVLAEVARGRSNREIAQALSISCDTVRTHLKRIYRKLGVEGRSALIAFALRAGMGAAGDENGAAEGGVNQGVRKKSPPNHQVRG